ncbi:MAG: hypothetical protein NTW29_22560 [Bacteroidetes bacterium]|nr:hypothetical protein [Bacteroidota bacterium]
MIFIIKYVPYLLAFLTGVLLTLLIILLSDHIDLRREQKKWKNDHGGDLQ